ncbi:MAG: hypothetical protein ACPLW7_06860, partial [Minisyncoccia bacterium]
MDNENMKRVNIRIPIDLYNEYKERSARTGIAMSFLMYMDLKNYRMIENINDNLVRALKIMDK